jgi:hypothetical protein
MGVMMIVIIVVIVIIVIIVRAAMTMRWTLCNMRVHIAVRSMIVIVVVIMRMHVLSIVIVTSALHIRFDSHPPLA